MTTFTRRSSTSDTDRAMPNRRWTWRAKSSATKPSSRHCSRRPCASSRGRDHRLPAKRVIDAPDSGAVRGDEQEKEAVDDRQLPLVLDRPETVRGVSHEIRHGHLAAGDECGDPGEETDGHQNAAD